MNKPAIAVIFLFFLRVTFAAPSPFGEAPAPVSISLRISPEEPSQMWSHTLSPNYTATVGLNVSPSGTAHGVEYRLKADPVFTTSSSDQNALWTGSATGNSATYQITNTAHDAATATASVSATWTPIGGAGGGGDDGETPFDISRSIDASVQLLDSYVEWDFTSPMESADGQSLIVWSASFYDDNNWPINVSGAEVTSTELAPADAAWDVQTTSFGTPTVIGTAKSFEGSTGKLKVTYNDGSPETDTATRELAFVKVTFRPLSNKAMTDLLPTPIDIIVEPESFTNRLSFSFTAKPTASGQPQNALGTTTLEFSRRGAASDQWQINKTIWYGVPGRLCSSYTNPYEITLHVRGLNDIKDTYYVSLPPELDEAEAIMDIGPFESVCIIEQAVPESGVPDWYRCKVTISEFYKRAVPWVPDVDSQYTGMIWAEENYHVAQMEGSVPIGEGGWPDMYTKKGIYFWLGWVGEGERYFYGNTPMAAEKAADRALRDAFQIECAISSKFLEDESGSGRRGLSEKVAKEIAGFREAYTLECTYPGIQIGFDVHPAYR